MCESRTVRLVQYFIHSLIYAAVEAISELIEDLPSSWREWNISGMFQLVYIRKPAESIECQSFTDFAIRIANLLSRSINIWLCRGLTTRETRVAGTGFTLLDRFFAFFFIFGVWMSRASKRFFSLRFRFSEFRLRNVMTIKAFVWSLTEFARTKQQKTKRVI